MRYVIFSKGGWPALVREDELLNWRYREPIAVCDTQQRRSGSSRS